MQSDITSMNIPDRSKYSESESIVSSPIDPTEEDKSKSMFILEPEEIKSKTS